MQWSNLWDIKVHDTYLYATFANDESEVPNMMQFLKDVYDAREPGERAFWLVGFDYQVRKCQFANCWSSV